MKGRNHVARKAQVPWLLLAVYLAGPGSALAELPPLYAACANPKTPADEKIAACSSIIRRDVTTVIISRFRSPTGRAPLE